MTAIAAAVSTIQHPMNAMALAVTFASVYCVVEIGRLSMNSWTLSFLSCTIPVMTSMMFRITRTQMSDTPPT